MRARLQLQVSSMWVCRVVGDESAIDVARMRVVALNQIRVVAVHRPHEVANGKSDDRMKLARELAGFPCQIEGQVLEHFDAYGGHEGSAAAFGLKYGVLRRSKWPD
jgi:hypothetical protein